MKKAKHQTNRKIIPIFYGLTLSFLGSLPAQAIVSYGHCPEPSEIKSHARPDGWTYNAATTGGNASLNLNGQLAIFQQPKNYVNFYLEGRQTVVCLYTLKNSLDLLQMKATLSKGCNLIFPSSGCTSITACSVECDPLVGKP